MIDFKSIITELNNLPKGYISKKKINGKYYYYYQYFNNGKKESVYIKNKDLELLQKKIKRRKELEKQIKKIEAKNRNLKEPSQRSKELTGDLMMGDEVVASFDKGNLVYVDLKKSPLLIKRTNNLYEFLKCRAIDRGRTHSRLLKKYLGINENDDAQVAIYSYGACITDNYWFKAKGSKLKYRDISFNNDFYSDLVLKGDVGFIPKYPKHSPQLTLPGSYEKCWKLINNEWYLYKKGSDSEIFSELFSSKLAKKIGVPTATYEYIDGYIRTKNIASNYNLEHIYGIAGDNDNYDVVFNSLYKISKNIAKQYLELILFDAIVYNVDRHNENCALFRDKKTGDIISLAPNYDNNISLTNATSNFYFNGKNDGMFKYINKFLSKCPEAKELIKSVKFKNLTQKDIKKIFDSIEIKVDEKTISKFIFERYEFAKNMCK